MSNENTVEVGQVWADKQKGEEGRTVRLIDLNERYATVELVTTRDNALTQPIGRKTRVLVNQIPHRFRLVSESEAEDHHA